MAEVFKYKNKISSHEFNSRFSDILLPSVLRGFYFEKGTGDFELTLTYGGDQSSAVIMRGGLRIEEDEVLEDIIELSPNALQVNRFDRIYAQYVYGSVYSEVQYIADEGNVNGPKEILPEDHYAYLGMVELQPGGNLSTAIFHYPHRGIHLPDISGKVTFKEKVIFENGVEISGGEGGDSSAVTQKEVTDFVFPYNKVISSNLIDESALFKKSTFYRKDATKFAESELRKEIKENQYEEIFVQYFDELGLTVIKTEVIKLTYDEFGQVIQKEKI